MPTTRVQGTGASLDEAMDRVGVNAGKRGLQDKVGAPRYNVGIVVDGNRFAGESMEYNAALKDALAQAGIQSDAPYAIAKVCVVQPYATGSDVAASGPAPLSNSRKYTLTDML